MPPSPPNHRTMRHSRKALCVRADAAHTFGTLLTPLALASVLLGFLLLQQALSHPLTTDGIAVIFPSVLLAAGLILLSYLLRSSTRYTLRLPHKSRRQKRTAIPRFLPSKVTSPQFIYKDSYSIPLAMQSRFEQSASPPHSEDSSSQLLLNL